MPHPPHWAYYISLEDDLIASNRYVEICEDNLDTYSTQFTRLLLAAASEVDVVAKTLSRGKAAQDAFIRDRLLRILKGKVHAVIRGLRRMATVQKLSKEKRADVDTACGYFAAHEHRMKYDEYLAAGFPIATGVIEGACRHLVKDRLERTGMRWCVSGAQAMLHLRCLKASDAWDDFQKQFLTPTPLRA